MPPKPKKRSSGTALAKKAKESGISLSILKQVKKRGDAAYLSSGSMNVPMAAWSMGRVNSFISGRGGARKADADLWKKAKASKRYTYGTLAKVYRRGQGAFLGAGSRRVPMAAWAMGRVNSFLRGSRKHDLDLRKKRKKK